MSLFFTALLGKISSFLSALPGAVAQGLIWGLMAIGVYITYKILDIADLTVDGSICTGAVVFAVILFSGANIWLAMLGALLAGMATGIVTGLFHTILGIPPILSGILTQLMLWSINLKILGGKANAAVPSRSYKVLVALKNNEQSILVLIGFVVVLIVALYWFFGTELGSSLRSTGSNLIMSRAQGINTNTKKILGLAISNGIVALSGALLAQYQGFADINMGRGAIVIGLAAVIIGEAALSFIAKNFAVKLLSVAIGGVIYFVVYTLIISLGIDTELLKMLSALVVAVFLGAPYVKSVLASKWRKKEKNNAEN